MCFRGYHMWYSCHLALDSSVVRVVLQIKIVYGGWNVHTVRGILDMTH